MTLPIRVSQRITIYRPIDAVFAFICSPQNPELETLRITEPLSPGLHTEASAGKTKDAVRWTLEVTEMTPPARVSWRTEYISGDLVIPGACSYELRPRGEATVVKQTYHRPLPPGLYRATLPVLWWKVRTGIRKRLRELKAILEA